MITIIILIILTLSSLVISLNNNNNMATKLEVKVNEALLLHKHGKFKEAIQAYESVLPLLEKGKLASSLYSNVGALYLQAGEYDQAKTQFDNSVQALPENAVAHFNLAIILTTKFNEHKKALVHSKKALQLDPNNHKVVHLIGNILQNLGQNDEADRWFVKAEEMVLNDNIPQQQQQQQQQQQYDVQDDKIIKKDLSFLDIFKVKIGDSLEREWNGIHYTMNCISEKPLLFKLPNFITPDECEHIINRANKSLEKSFVMGGNQNSDEPYRDSYNAWLARDSILEDILHRLEPLIAIPTSYFLQKAEELQVVKYEKQGQFKLHHDSSNFHPRLFTLLIYLNEMAEDSGGETYFPFTGIERSIEYTIEDAISRGLEIYKESKDGTYCIPKLGDALLFFNYNIDGKLDASAVHAGCRIKNDSNKWIANYWVDYDIDLLLDLVKETK